MSAIDELTQKNWQLLDSLKARGGAVALWLENKGYICEVSPAKGNTHRAFARSPNEAFEQAHSRYVDSIRRRPR